MIVALDRVRIVDTLLQSIQISRIDAYNNKISRIDAYNNNIKFTRMLICKESLSLALPPDPVSV